MSSSAPANGASGRQRRLCEPCPQRSRPQVLFLFSGTFLLICTVTLAAYSLARQMLSFAVSMIATSLVFLLVLVVVGVNKGLRKPEEEPQAPGDAWRYRIEHIEI